MKTFSLTVLLSVATIFSCFGQNHHETLSGKNIAQPREYDVHLTHSSKTVVMRSKVAVRVLDKYTLKPVNATMIVVGQRPGKQINPKFEDGVYKFIIPVNDTSIISIYAADYEMLTESVTAGKMNATEVFYLTPKIKTDSTGNASRRPDDHSDVNNILLKEDFRTVLHFPQSLSFLLPAAEQELEILAAFMTRHNACKIELAGHTDDLGDDYKNMLLSYDRVDEVKKFLISRQIAADRIRGRGFGSTSPIAPNDSEANRKLNRRVEVRISSAK